MDFPSSISLGALQAAILALEAAGRDRRAEPAEPISKYIDLPRVKLYKAHRNDPCPCGSGKKYKKCCIAKTK